MKRKIIEIEEIGFPQSLVLREGASIGELIKTEELIDELFKQSKLAEMLSKTNIIESLIQFVAEAGGEVDLKEVRYWGYTYLESLTDSKQKDREKCGRCDRTGQLMKVELLNTGEIVEAVEQDHNSITYYKNGVAHLVPKSAVIFIKN